MTRANTNIRSVTRTIDLSKIYGIDNGASISSADIVAANAANKKVYFESLTKLLGLANDESAVIETIILNKTANSGTLTSNADTNVLKIQRVNATAGKNSSTPTISGNETLAAFTLSSTNLTAANSRPMTRTDLTSVSGSLSAGPVGVRDTDQGTVDTGGAIVMYADATTATLGALALTGKINVIIFYRKVDK